MRTLKLKTYCTRKMQVKVCGDVSLLQTYHEIVEEGGVFSEQARAFFLFQVPIIPCCGMEALILGLIGVTINEMRCAEPATLKEITAHSASQGLFHFTPKWALQIIHKHITPTEGEKFAFLTKVHQEVTLITLEYDAHGNKRIDVQENGKIFPARGSLYTFMFCL